MEQRGRGARGTGLAVFSLLVGLVAPPAGAGPKPRARDIGIPFDGATGELNSITDVPGVTVGHTTLIAGEGPLRVGEGPVRTGVTAVLPRGAASLEEQVFAGWFALNGNGEMTGAPWIEESGQLAGPIMLTNTNSVGVVRDAVLQWWVDKAPDPRMEVEWSLPVVAETHDGYLNDINGFHVKPQHVFRALESASGGAVPEGNVGGGTGMVCFGFKGGIGTSSRLVLAAGRRHAVGVLVQTNFGRRHQLRIAGVSVGRDLREAIPYASLDPRVEVGGAGSIVAVVATDAPLLPHQLKRLARRVALGVARTGGVAMDGSGDLFVAFSTASRGLGSSAGPVQLSMLPNELLDPLFAATVQATEESIVNALVAADDMTGVDNHSVMALPHDRVRQLLRARGLLGAQGQ